MVALPFQGLLTQYSHLPKEAFLSFQEKKESVTPILQKQKNIDPQKQRRPVELENLVGMIQAGVPEFATDSLVKVIENDIIKDRQWKIEILEEAFRLSSSVAHKFKKHSVVGNIDTRYGYLSYAYDLNFDELSLKCRAIRAILPLDKKLSREWFSEISQFKLPSLKCEDLMVYDVSSYYDLLPDLISQAFNPDEMRRGEHIFTIQVAISNISSPVQIGPMLRVLSTLKLPPSEIGMLIPSLNKLFSNTSGDPRSFDWAMISLPGHLAGFIGECEGKHIDVSSLLGAYKLFLINNFNSNWCRDAVSWKAKPNEYPKPIDLFNNKLLSQSKILSTVISPISLEEIRTKKIEQISNTYEYWKTPESRQLYINIKKLKFGTKNKALDISERLSNEWQAEHASYLKELTSWQGSSEISEADYFHQKSLLLQILIELTPQSNPNFDTLLNSYISFMSQNRFQQESWAEWYWHVMSLYQRLGQQNRSKLIAVFSNSRDINLRIFAQIEAVNNRDRKTQ